jgi:hypothetical protein
VTPYVRRRVRGLLSRFARDRRGAALVDPACEVILNYGPVPPPYRFHLEPPHVAFGIIEGRRRRFRWVHLFETGHVLVAEFPVRTGERFTGDDLEPMGRVNRLVSRVAAYLALSTDPPPQWRVAGALRQPAVLSVFTAAGTGPKRPT